MDRLQEKLQRNLQETFGQQIADLRREHATGFGDLRREHSAEFADLRREHSAEFADLRREIAINGRLLPFQIIREDIFNQRGGLGDTNTIATPNEVTHGGNVVEDVIWINEKASSATTEQNQRWNRTF